MWNYFGQKSTKVLLAFLLLAGAGGIIVASYNNNDNKTNTSINQTESSDAEISDDTLKDEDAKAENSYAEPQGVSESSNTQNGQSYSFFATGEEENSSTSSATQATSTSVTVSSVEDVQTTTATPKVETAKKETTTKETAKNNDIEIAAVQKEVKQVASMAVKKDVQVSVAVENKSEDNNVSDEVEGTKEDKISGAESNNVNIDNPKADEESSKTTKEEEAKIRAEEEQEKANTQAQELEQVLYPGLYTGQDNNTIFNTYPWQTDCPEKQDAYLTTINGIKVGGYVCECVSYVGWKAFEEYGLYLGWGNAYSWDDRARANGYVVNKTPAEKTIGQVDGGVYGHVFWVEKVNNDGSIDVSEYNNAYATMLLTGYSYYGDFGTRTISASEAKQYNYIHLHK